LQRATVRHAVQRLRHAGRRLRDVSFEQVEAAVRIAREKPAGAQATLPLGLLLTASRDTITIAGEDAYPAPDWPQAPSRPLALDLPGCTLLPDGGSVTTRIVDRTQVDGDWIDNADPWRAYLDADAVGTGIVLRRRQPGDRFCPLGMQGQHKWIGEFLINETVPAQWRDWVPILVQRNGQIAWICGWRIDDRVRVTDKTTRVMIVQFDPASENRTA
jgi:tRNA(Ile)-lysidine synthase